MSIHKPFGNLTGLKAQQLRQLERLYRRKVAPGQLLTPELARQLTEISAEDLHRQVGVLLDRQGLVTHVLVGDAKGLIIPPLPRERGAKGRLKGLSLMHTHLDSSTLTQDDLMDLALLRLDAVAAIVAGPDGLPGAVAGGAPAAPAAGRPQLGRHQGPPDPGSLDLDFAALVASLEEELARLETAGEGRGRERAILIGITGTNRAAAEDSMEELAELARSAGLKVAATIIQRRPRFDPRFLMGKGKLSELVVQALQLGVGPAGLRRRAHPLPGALHHRLHRTQGH